MMIDDIAWCEFTDENGNTYGGNIRADKNGVSLSMLLTAHGM